MDSFRFHIDRTVLNKLLVMSVPMIISQGAFALMIFTDRYFLAHLSPAHMAAAMGGGVAWFFSYSLFSGILAYANALVAQYLGAQESHKCSKVVTQGVALALCCLPVLLVIAHYMRQIFAGMGHSPRQVTLEQTYYDILMLGAVLSLVKVVLSSFFSGIGRTRVVMICEVLGIFFNVPLSYVLLLIVPLRTEFDAVLAPYHDVGMTAVKVAGFGRGVNITLGLPFVRTSPDHGTAMDLAGKGTADPSSMREALRVAVRLVVRGERASGASVT